MSVATWLNEFYPIPVSAVTKERALDQAILKWDGLTPENLAKHKCFLTSGYVMSMEGIDIKFRINGTTCALCYHYIKKDKGCTECPIPQRHKEASITEERCRTEYQIFWFIQDPNPMRQLLARAKQNQIKCADIMSLRVVSKLNENSNLL